MQELRELTRFRDRARTIGMASLVAVEEPGRARNTVGVDRGERRDHRRDRHAPGVDVAERVEGTARTLVPRVRGVVLEAQRRRHEELVRDARPGDDLAVGVDRDRLDRRGSDVDPDRELRHGRGH